MLYFRLQFIVIAFYNLLTVLNFKLLWRTVFGMYHYDKSPMITVID